MPPGQTAGLRYSRTVPAGLPSAVLVADPGTPSEQRIPFCRVLEIGRDEPGRQVAPGLLLLADPMVSHRHCIIDCTTDGRCYVRDVSRNGTRVGGRRILPNVETAMRHGETLTVGSHQFVLDTGAPDAWRARNSRQEITAGAPAQVVATVLVGDIRDYTVLVRSVPSALLQRSVSRLFEVLTAAILERGGTVKDYAGDAVVAFWEGPCEGMQARDACRAALDLDRLARQIAVDPSVWDVKEYPLVMDWALASGVVTINPFGGIHPQGLSLVGEPVVLAFRLEKLADEGTGSVLACGATRSMAGEEFLFRDLGELTPEGFDRPDRYYALLGPSA